MLSRRTLLSALTPLGLATSLLAQIPKKKAASRERHGLEEFDAIMNEVLEENRVAGGSLAIAREGKLVLARGYGVADVATRRPVTPETLFCIASVTKAVSAVAALKLAEQKKLPLEAKLVDILADLRPEGVEPADPRLKEITIHHLLYHASGIPDRIKGSKVAEENDDDDGNGGKAEAAAKYRSLLGLKLDFDPGSSHRYSNTGFLILRLAIERAAKQDYVPFVREHVFAPMGIKSIVMETETPIPEETGRYVLGPNGIKPAARPVHNWLATPADMVKFLTALDGSRGEPFLPKRLYRRMLAPPPPPVLANANGTHLGLGWDSVRNLPDGDQFSKDGGKPGVVAWLEHLPGGVSWAMMLNTSKVDKTGPNPRVLIVRRVQKAIADRKTWPAIDLFHR